MIYSVLTCVVGIMLIVYFSEKLVESTVGTSLHVGLSTFLISVIFIGFDPENLALGSVASYEGVSGIAMGTVMGSAMVALALALGITALIAPMKFKKVPMQIPLIQVGAVLLFGGLCLDGMLSRVDGMLLLLGYGLALWYLIYLGNRGLDIRPTGEAAEALEEGKEFGKWQAIGLLVISLLAIIAGSEIVVDASSDILAGLELSDTVFGMSALALVVSIEELAREIPAALKGHPEITMGNVIGSVLAFFLFNAGIIALVNPIPIGSELINFYLPVSLAIVLFVTSLMIQKSIGRWAGAILVVAYVGFFLWGYF
ncbi:sodium:calcium antiporter [Fodinibius halophilus]|uniref:Sodium:calcium antiporter n=1 Tax=Fodinibius halophilus TaxID=1736908 RepID=A0A6M1T4C7_9BACT|nr:sodium:calcium antiporter [Fodinibius halophilus]NGP86821.1 sodium:calcium antiporter [Fodinibius halophilus]